MKVLVFIIYGLQDVFDGNISFSNLSCEYCKAVNSFHKKLHFNVLQGPESVSHGSRPKHSFW